MLSEYQGTLPKVASNTSTILTHLYPMTPIELGDGFVIGKDKVLTKASGIFRNGRGSKAIVCLYEECVEVAVFSAEDEEGSGEAVQVTCAFTPLQYWLFTPELQWQSRGKWCLREGPRARHLPLNYSGNLGVNVSTFTPE